MISLSLDRRNLHLYIEYPNTLVLTAPPFLCTAKDLPDIVFTANAGIVREKKVYLANFTNEQRKPEWKINEKWFKENGFTTFFNPELAHEGTGDALWINHGKVLLAGIGPRSDPRALDDIKNKLKSDGDDFMVLAVKLIDPRSVPSNFNFQPLSSHLFGAKYGLF
ncbi:unnamed protein product [Cylicostephanus goldi]|uniref:Uncharacterized protein n=1 Tax=Cylicostephanus goldi TaxID=71465 RepID=A0A3P6S5U9_CYLGO|nr:unnamed protein product [Cylicostephanus goldi]